MRKISFIIPCYSSENTIADVVQEIENTVNERPNYDYEIILVNDHSPDNVWQKILYFFEFYFYRNYDLKNVNQNVSLAFLTT